MSKVRRKIVASAGNTVLFVGTVLVFLQLLGIDFRIYACLALLAVVVVGSAMSLLSSWAFSDAFDELDPINPAGEK